MQWPSGGCCACHRSAPWRILPPSPARPPPSACPSAPGKMPIIHIHGQSLKRGKKQAHLQGAATGLHCRTEMSPFTWLKDRGTTESQRTVLEHEDMPKTKKKRFENANCTTIGINLMGPSWKSPRSSTVKASYALMLVSTK